MTHTCSGCDATWTGLRTAHCAAAGCHRTFTVPAHFDRHRRDGECLDPATIEGLRLVDGIWTGPPRPEGRALGSVQSQGATEAGSLVPSPQPDPSDAHRANQRIDVGRVDPAVGQ